MANDKKNIEDVFKALNDFKVEPQAQVWEGIEKKLVAKNKPIAWFTFRYAVGFIALLSVGIAILLNLIQPPAEFAIKNSISYQKIINKHLLNSSLLNIQKVEQKTIKSIKISALSSTSKLKKSYKETIVSPKIQAKEKTKPDNSSHENELFTAAQSNYATASKENGFFDALHQLSFQQADFKIQLQPMRLNDLPLASVQNQNTSRQLANQIKNEKEEVSTSNQLEERSLLSRFSVTPGVSPVFSGGNSAASYAKEMKETAQGTTNLSFGLQVAYEVTDKLSLRTGVHQIGSGYQTNNIVASYQSNPNQIATIAMGAGANLTFMDAKTFSEVTSPNARMPYSETSLTHELGFLEIPMEASYQVINKKIGVSLIGGMSTLLVNENRILGDFQGETYRIGSANNVNSTSFSANFGMGFNYQFTKKIKFHIEPNLRYQINTFDSATTNFKPYMIGVFSGIKFEF